MHTRDMTFAFVLKVALLIAAPGVLYGAEAGDPPRPERATTPTPAAAPQVSPNPPLTESRITALSFLAGTWQGEMNGAFVEEIWSAPKGNNIVGNFRWLKPDGTPAMFEMLAITQEGNDVRLRLRHYTPTLAAREPVDKPQTLILAESSATRALFKAEKDAGALSQISYEVKDDTLHIVVEFVASDPPREALKFALARVKISVW